MKSESQPEDREYPRPRIIMNGQVHEGRNLTTEEFAPFHEGFIRYMGSEPGDRRPFLNGLRFYSALGLPLPTAMDHLDAILQVVPSLVKDQMAIHSDDPLPSIWRDHLLARDPDFAYNLDELSPGKPLTDSDQE